MRPLAAPFVMLSCVTAFAAAGCVAPGAGKFVDHYPEAEWRWTGSFSTAIDERRCHNIPHGKHLEVFMRYSVDGDGEIRLRGQDGPVQRFPLGSGTDVTHDPWNTFDPVFGGEWCFEVDTKGRGDFAFAFDIR